MKTKTFVTGELCKVKGKFELFRYVKKNIVRSVATGKIMSVKFEDLRKTKENSFAGNLDRLWTALKIAILAIISAIAIYALLSTLNF